MSDGTNPLLPESAESGTNYCKMADGTLMQYGHKSGIIVNSGATVSETISFPLEFSPIVSVLTIPQTSLAQYFRTTVNAVSDSSFDVCVHSSYTSSANLTIRWFAIGRWK